MAFATNFSRFISHRTIVSAEIKICQRERVLGALFDRRVRA
jgi:hypothetical protein